MSTRILPKHVCGEVNGRLEVSWHPIPYLTHTILPVYCRIRGGVWAVEYRVYNAAGEEVASFSSQEYAEKAIQARVDLTQERYAR